MFYSGSNTDETCTVVISEDGGKLLIVCFTAECKLEYCSAVLGKCFLSGKSQKCNMDWTCIYILISFDFPQFESVLHMAQDNFMHSHPAEHHRSYALLGSYCTPSATAYCKMYIQ